MSAERGVGARRSHPVDALAAAAMAVVIAFWVSARVSGFTTDSDAYLDVAANLRAGRGLVQTVVDFWRPGLPDPLGMWPPLYPALVAIVAAFGTGLEPAGLIVSGASFVLFAVAFQRLCARILERDLPLSVTWIACSTLGVTMCAAHAWSEATYLALVTAGFLGLARLRAEDHEAEPGGRRGAFAAGLLFGAAALTRYAGVPVALLAVFAVGAWPSTRRHAGPFALGALAPPALWVAHNLAVFGHPFGPELPPGTSGIATRVAELVAALRWELPPAPADRSVLVAAGLLLVLSVGFVRALVRPGLARAAAATAALSLAVVVVATATSAINAPGGRYLAPALPFIWLAAFSGLGGAPDARARRAGAVHWLALLLALGSAWKLYTWAHERPSRAIASLERRNDRAALAQLVPAGDSPVLSDAGHLLRLATGRPAVQIPPASYRLRSFDASDLARWRARGVTLAVVRRGGESDSTLRAFGATDERADARGGFVRLRLP